MCKFVLCVRASIVQSKYKILYCVYYFKRFSAISSILDANTRIEFQLFRRKSRKEIVKSPESLFHQIFVISSFVKLQRQFGSAPCQNNENTYFSLFPLFFPHSYYCYSVFQKEIFIVSGVYRTAHNISTFLNARTGLITNFRSEKY